MKSFHKIRERIIFSIATAILGMQGIEATPLEESAIIAGGKSRIVHFHFPHDFSLGGLYMIPQGESGSRGQSSRQGMGTARGDKTITLAPGQTILLFLDRQLFLHPDKLDGTDLSGSSV